MPNIHCFFDQLSRIFDQKSDFEGYFILKNDDPDKLSGGSGPRSQHVLPVYLKIKGDKINLVFTDSRGMVAIDLLLKREAENFPLKNLVKAINKRYPSAFMYFLKQGRQSDNSTCPTFALFDIEGMAACPNFLEHVQATAESPPKEWNTEGYPYKILDFLAYHLP